MMLLLVLIYSIEIIPLDSRWKIGGGGAALTVHYRPFRISNHITRFQTHQFVQQPITKFRNRKLECFRINHHCVTCM